MEEVKVLLCVIAKKENLYIREFIDHYKKLGVTNIVIYDNNDSDGERFDEVLKSEISSGFVEIVEYYDRKVCQLTAYKECYSRFWNKFDWIMFFDVDEYLTINEFDNVCDFLNDKRFEPFDIIHFNWMVFGDNDIIYHTSNEVVGRFTTPVDYGCHIGYNFPENNHVKSVIRGKKRYLVGVPWANPHTLKGNFSTCNASGESISNETFINYDFRDAYLKHYTTKTISEYCDKLERGLPDSYWPDKRKTWEWLLNERFFKTNKVVPEKIEIVKKRLNIDLSYLLKK